ncbi:MAG: hypothetical protein GY765_34300, partial [bacterium]|nr:hypothetical protein [bacterium]
NKKRIENFFSPQWFIVVGLIIILCIAGFAFLTLSKSDYIETILVVYGSIFQLLATACYLYFGYNQLFGNANFKSFLGSLAIFIVLISIVAVALKMSNSFHVSVYFWAASSLIYLLMGSYKYAFGNIQVELSALGREIVILVVGAILFFASVLAARRQSGDFT